MPRRRQGSARGPAHSPGSLPAGLHRAAERLLSTAPLRACRQQFLQCLQGIDAAELENLETKSRRLAFLDGDEGADEEETVLLLVCSALCRCEVRRDSEEYTQTVGRVSHSFFQHILYTITHYRDHCCYVLSNRPDPRPASIQFRVPCHVPSTLATSLSISGTSSSTSGAFTIPSRFWVFL